MITITPPGSSTVDVTYKVLYIPTESGWMTFPDRVIESPLRVSEMTVTLGGKWDGSAFQGGRSLTSALRVLEYNLNNSLEIDFVPGAGAAYASRCFRPARTQTLKVDKDFRDFILQQHISDNDTFGFYVKAEGAAIDESHNYQVEMIFPKVGVH